MRNFQGPPQWDARLPTHLAHTLLDERAVAKHVIGASLQGQRQDCGELGGLLPVDIPGRDSVIVTAGRLRSVNTRSPFHYVEVQLENAPLAQEQFGHRDQCELGTLAKDGASGSEKQ